eukprot:m.146757 g.146757  ORF g.146757 m.146757 type:complete len:106 (-) comp16093_c0_seq25:86-403(-)
MTASHVCRDESIQTDESFLEREDEATQTNNGAVVRYPRAETRATTTGPVAAALVETMPQAVRAVTTTQQPTASIPISAQTTRTAGQQLSGVGFLSKFLFFRFRYL